MSPRRLQQRRRILAARAISERIAAADHAAATQARADAAALAKRLAREIDFTAPGAGQTSGAMFAARAALSDRLRAATATVAAREGALSAGETLAASRAMAARMQRRSAESLVERAEDAVTLANERRHALPPCRTPDRNS
jgi:hypothetical protein